MAKKQKSPEEEEEEEEEERRRTYSKVRHSLRLVKNNLDVVKALNTTSSKELKMVLHHGFTLWIG